MKGQIPPRGSSDASSVASSVESSSPPPGGSSDASSVSSSSAAAADSSSGNHHHQQRATPATRRGHFKSRLGCFNCKRRRVKCNELRPLCSPCRRLGLTCQYPTSAVSSATASDSQSGLVVGRMPFNNLALDDLHFYHQFLTAAFPTLPLKASDLWSQCAAMSHSYESLAHAALGLGASHLTQNSDADFAPQALQHRVTAIRLVNERLSQPVESQVDADALLATVLCLVTQSSLMEDSMLDYVTMIRGGNLIVNNIMGRFDNSIFAAFNKERHVATLGTLVSEQPKDPMAIDEFRKSVAALGPLCRMAHEQQYHQSLLKSINDLEISSLEAWKEFVTLFMMPGTFSNDDFLSFIEPDNWLAQLLLIHQFLLEYVLGQFCIDPSNEPKCHGRKKVVISWARNVANNAPPEYQPYTPWVRKYTEVLAAQDGRYLFSP